MILVALNVATNSFCSIRFVGIKMVVSKFLV
jgi:hypothetical protein